MLASMDPDRWQRIETLFHSALEQPVQDRDEFLREACADDPGLLREVRSLLDVDGLSCDVLHPASTPLKPEGLRPGQSIGPYRVEARVASGGMGTVYRALRDDAQVRRRVAIKVINPGMDSRAIVRRFELERRALAALDHPNIARFLDGGTTPDGSPYLVMEYVEGEPLDAYASRHSLSVRDRLLLFSAVCAGAHYAHRKLVVHRDIKPANVLVTAEGQPKLLDFGIAKILDPGRTIPGLTTASQRFLSPEYASPEQVRGEAVTTSTDIYSLGVTLYELLTGARPYRVTDRSPAELERIVCEQDPTLPSASVAQRKGKRNELSRRLAGDLDTIVLKAMRKEPEERYPSADELSQDLRRHLDGLPVVARKPTLGYRIGKFARRNRAAVVVAGVLLLSVVAGAAGFIRQNLRVRAEAATTRRILLQMDSLLADLADQARGGDVSVEQVLDHGSERVMAELGDTPQAQAMLAERIAGIYDQLGRHAKALPWRERALELYRAAYGEGHAKTADSMYYLARTASAVNELARAEKLYREALDRQRRAYGDESVEVARTTGVLGAVLWHQGRYGEAEPLLRQSIATYRRLPPGDELQMVETLRTTANYLQDMGRYAEAESLAREALELARKLPPPHDPRLFVSTLAGILQDIGRYEEAETLFAEHLELLRRRLGDNHPDVASDKLNLALVRKDRGDLASAERICREVLASLESHPESGTPVVIGNAWSALAHVLWEQGDAAGAEAAIRTAIPLTQRHAGRDERLTLLAQTLIAAGAYDEAESIARTAWNELKTMLPADSWKTAKSASVLGAALVALERFEEAEPLLVESYPRIRDDRGPSHPRTRDAMERIVVLYDRWGRPDRAAGYEAMLATVGSGVSDD